MPITNWLVTKKHLPIYHWTKLSIVNETREFIRESSSDLVFNYDITISMVKVKQNSTFENFENFTLPLLKC